MKDQHKLADKLSTEMRQIFEAAENNMIIVSSSELAKNNSLSQKKQNIIKKAENVAKVVDREIAKTTNSKEFIKDTKKFTGMMLNTAIKNSLRTAKKINRLESVDDIQRSIYQQTQDGINNGIKIKTKRGKMGYKEYMEMKVRTNIQSEISERQLDIGAKAKIVFYIVNEFADCADDHADYQGKVYYDERWQSFGFTDEAQTLIAKRILDERMLSVQQVRNQAPYLTTRPNCRHSFKPIPIDTAINVNPDKILQNNQWTTGSYKDSNYEATQEQRYNERNIRKYKAKAEMNMQMYKETGNKQFLNASRKARLIYRKYRDRQINLIKNNPELERDYRRESAKILVNDLGVKYNLPKEDKVLLDIKSDEVILGDKEIYEPFIETGTYSQQRKDLAYENMKNLNKIKTNLALVTSSTIDNVIDPTLNSLKGYLSRDFKTINKYLRGYRLGVGDTLDETGAEIYARDISSILQDNKTPVDVVVKRFIDSTALMNLFGITRDEYKRVRNGDLDLVRNVTFVEKGFMSTTILEKPPGYFAEMDLELEIFVPKGTRAMYVALDELTTTVEEEELLIDKGYEFKVIGFEEDGENAFGDTKYKAIIELIHLEEENDE